MIDVFKIVGITGLVLIILGVIIKPKNRKARDYIYILGGVLLTFYSYHINDYIFIILQIIFVIVAIYDLIKLSK